MYDIKIMHMADVHLGSALTSLPYDKIELRRKELLYTFIQALSNAKDCDILLLSGDVFDIGGVPLSVVDTFLESIEALGDIPVFYACGNHDSYYTDAVAHCLKYKPRNLHIFSPDKIEYVSIDSLKCRVYGASFSSTRCYEPMLADCKLPNDDYVNILCMHADISQGGFNYLDVKELSRIGFDYAALGHIHSHGIYKSGDTFYAYSGITEGRGFDECGENGYIMGTVSKGYCSLDFVPAAKRIYIDEKLDISEFNNEYELLEVLRSLSMNDGNICRFTLVGENNLGKNIDCDFLNKQLGAYYSICIDNTRTAISVEDYISNSDFKGICASKALDMINNSDDDNKREKIKRAFSLLAELFE